MPSSSVGTVPSGTPTANASTGRLSVVTSEDPLTSAKLRVLELGGTTCLSEREPDIDFERLALDAKAADVDGTGILEAGDPSALETGDAFVGTRVEAAAGFGARELHVRREGSNGFAVGTELTVAGAESGAYTGFRLDGVDLADGRTARVVTATFTSVTCAAEPSE